VPEPVRPDPVFRTEWCLWFRTKLLKIKSSEYLRRFFIDLYLVSEGDWGFLRTEQDHQNKNYLVTEAKSGTTARFVGTNLEHCLPGVYWANIFGRDYVKWFGEEKFADLPCYCKEKLADGSYYVQSSDDLYYFEKPDAVNYVDAIKQHLGPEAFFDIHNPDRKCKVPEFAKRRVSR
jgi:hypothetical protein